MTKEFWLNLPVKNIGRSKEFFRALGFNIKEDSPGYTATSAPMMIGNKNVVVMLFEEAAFMASCMNGIADTSKGSEMLMSIDAETRDEVDELAKKAAAAGGKVFAQPMEFQGWMYGCGFTDLDGHRWNVLNMDMSRMK